MTSSPPVLVDLSRPHNRDDVFCDYAVRKPYSYPIVPVDVFDDQHEVFSINTYVDLDDKKFVTTGRQRRDTIKIACNDFYVRIGAPRDAEELLNAVLSRILVTIQEARRVHCAVGSGFDGPGGEQSEWQ